MHFSPLFSIFFFLGGQIFFLFEGQILISLRSNDCFTRITNSHTIVG